MQTISEMNLSYVINHKDFTLGLCSFLDEFKRSSDKYSLIENPPSSEDAERVNLCILAAVTHKLANDHKMDVPSWVSDPFYIMPYPVFAHNTTNKDYQDFLINDAPTEFSSKNIFYSSRAIERV